MFHVSVCGYLPPQSKAVTLEAAGHVANLPNYEHVQHYGGNMQASSLTSFLQP